MLIARTTDHDEHVYVSGHRWEGGEVHVDLEVTDLIHAMHGRDQTTTPEVLAVEVHDTEPESWDYKLRKLSYSAMMWEVYRKNGDVFLYPSPPHPDPQSSVYLCEKMTYEFFGGTEVLYVKVLRADEPDMDEADRAYEEKREQRATEPEWDDLPRSDDPAFAHERLDHTQG